MSWTEDRIAILTKLWAEGLSASQIAAELGGVTRTAVIGKVHRLGLSGRAKPAGKARSKSAGRARSRSKALSTKQTTQDTGARHRLARVVVYNSDGSTALSEVEIEEDFFEPSIQSERQIEAPDTRELTLLQLTESTCKWPTGDPTMPGFSFCGSAVADDKPYCSYHNKLAFQPPSERRRRVNTSPSPNDAKFADASNHLSLVPDQKIVAQTQSSAKIESEAVQSEATVSQLLDPTSEPEKIPTDIQSIPAHDAVQQIIETMFQVGFRLEQEVRFFKQKNNEVEERNESISIEIESLDLEYLRG